MISLTRDDIGSLIKEEIEGYFIEHRGKPMHKRGIRGQQIAKKRAEDNAFRTSKEAQYRDKVFAGKKELDSLARGVVAEIDSDDEILSKTQNQLVNLHSDINKLVDLKNKLVRQIKIEKERLSKIIKDKDLPTQEDLFHYCDKLNRTSKGKYTD